MAKIITIANNKGGTGKTTTAVNLGAALRLHGQDVLLVDADGQYNLTETLRVPTDGGTLYNAIREQAATVTPARILSKDEKKGVLDALPSSRDLSALDAELSKTPDAVTRLYYVLDKYRDSYDVIIIDTPPALGLLSISATYATDEIIITANPSYLAVRGLLNVSATIQTIAENRKKPISVRVLFTQYDRRKSLHRITVDQVRAAGFDVFNTMIRDNVALAEMVTAGVDIFQYAPTSHGARDYDALAIEYITISKPKTRRAK